jgi:hypothetical protein
MSEREDATPAGPSSSEIVFYQGEDGRSRIQVRLDDGTVWLTQRLLSDLFQKDVRTINEHIQNIFDEEELVPEATIRKFRIVQTEGNREVSRLVDHYNLDVVLAVGYRVRSNRGTQFRRWATERLTEYLKKGFVLDDERLKEGRSLGTDYFKELLERIREIRASEKRFYQQIRDLYALAVDYDPATKETKEFFQIVQNKLHWAVTGSTAAEIVAQRADASKPNMGLTTWKGAKVRKADVTVAKNYLNDDEIWQLNRIVTMYLDYAEEQAERRRPLYMRDWRDKLDAFLQFNERAVLKNAGKVTAEVAQKLAEGEYDKFERKRISEEASAPDPFEETAKRLSSPSRTSKTKREAQ